MKIVSALLAAMLLSAVVSVALHHHDRHDGAEDHCTLCWVGQILASSGHAVAPVKLAQPVFSWPQLPLCKIIPRVKNICLKTLCIHGPPFA
jgi:hypothetical protein